MAIEEAVTVGHDADGNAIYKWANGRTKKELEANKEELRRAHINGAVAIRRDIFFGEFVTDWYRVYKEPYLSASSKANYRSTLNHYLFPVFGDKQMRAITSLQLQSYLNSLAGTGKTTLCYIMIILTNCFTLATAQGVIDRNAADGLRPPKAERTSRRALTAQETAAVLRVIDSHPDGLLLAILYYTGLRRGEALGLRWSDIDFAARALRVERDIDFVTGDVGTVKTETSVRTVPVPDELMALLQKNRQIGNGYIIRAQRTGEYWSQSTFVRRWRLLQAALLNAARGKIDHRVRTPGRHALLRNDCGESQDGQPRRHLRGHVRRAKIRRGRVCVYSAGQARNSHRRAGKTIVGRAGATNRHRKSDHTALPSAHSR